MADGARERDRAGWRPRRRTSAVLVVVYVLMAVVSAVQLAMTLLGGDAVTWRAWLRGFLVVAAPVWAWQQWRHLRRDPEGADDPSPPRRG